MSAPLTRDDILFIQRLLKSQGLYTGPLNGSWNTATEAADQAAEMRSTELAAQLGTFDQRSEANIRTLHLKAQEAARAFLSAFAGSAYVVKIISGTRTYAQQDALFAQGRTKPGKKVTNARGGGSNHNFGIAWDIGIFVDGKYLGESPLYKEAATLGLAATTGVEWGGNWTSFPDKPHYQLATGKALAEVRELFESGRPYIASA